MRAAASALARIVRGGTNPLMMLPPLLEAMPAGTRLPLLELLELARGADGIGPDPTPAWARGLFQAAGDASGLSPELLGALAAALSRSSPSYEALTRSGILGTPRVLLDGGSCAVSPEALAARDRAAVATLQRGVEAATQFIVQQRAELGLLGALTAYLELGGSYDIGGELERVLWCYVVLLARNAPGDKLDTLQELTRGR